MVAKSPPDVAVPSLELMYEMEPVLGRDELALRVRALKELVDWIDVPDSPMGKARQFSPIVSCLIKMLERDVGVIAHMRTIDLSSVALKSALRSLVLCGVERVVFVRGDVVNGSTIVKDVDPEGALLLVRQHGLGISPGLTLSLRKELDEIRRRLSLRADFYLVLNLNTKTADKLAEVSREARKVGARLYPYLVIATETNYGALVKYLGPERVLRKDEALKVVSLCANLVDGFLVSAPRDFREGLSFLRELRSLL